MTSNIPENKWKYSWSWSWCWYDPPEKRLITSFCQNSSLHGLRFIAEPKRHICERILWLAAFIVAISVSSTIIWEMWSRYRALPIINVPSPELVTIERIPFPAVTICNINRIKKSQVEYYDNIANGNVNNTNNEDAKEAQRILKIIKGICDSENRFNALQWTKGDFFGRVAYSVALRAESRNNGPNSSQIVTNLFAEGAAGDSCKNLIRLCRWNGRGQRTFCKSQFKPVKTEFGFCCTFNFIDPMYLSPLSDINETDTRKKEWKQYGLHYENFPFVNKENSRHYHHQLLPGLSQGLSIALETDPNKFHCLSSGFVVALNNPLQYPGIRENGVRIDLQSETFINLRPEISIPDESIKSFPIDKRQCYFNNEKELSEYLIYSQTNCIDECVANLTDAHCPNVAKCFKSSWDFGYLCEPSVHNCSWEDANKPFNQSWVDVCTQCLPTCTRLKYHPTVSYKPLKEKFAGTYMSFSSESLKEMSVVHIYFDDFATTPNIQKEQYGIIDLLANSGGTLGLCLGFSGLSLLELIYYFTVRVFFKHFRKPVCEDDGSSTSDTIDLRENDKESVHEMERVPSRKSAWRHKLRQDIHDIYATKSRSIFIENTTESSNV